MVGESQRGTERRVEVKQGREEGGQCYEAYEVMDMTRGSNAWMD